MSFDHTTKGLDDNGLPQKASETGTKVPQAIRIDLTRDILNDILSTARAGAKPLHVKFGNNLVRNTAIHCYCTWLFTANTVVIRQ